MKKELILKQIKKKIRNELPLDYKILLFGSWARGDALKTSDLDIGILGKKKIPWSIMVKILESVEKIPTLRKIDIVDLNATEKRFKNNALKHAKII
ncbi:MAG: nucleotidyltransferase domain-containing protein [Candidatus Magasanikbacteria bacterium]|nr:nucleotidyltransferase domain-containing protein [Candidatus Magasanikbacteria bacterium]